MVLAPLNKKYDIRRVIVSTYQSVTGTGKDAVDQLNAEIKGETPQMVYPTKFLKMLYLIVMYSQMTITLKRKSN